MMMIEMIDYDDRDDVVRKPMALRKQKHHHYCSCTGSPGHQEKHACGVEPRSNK